MRAGHGLAVSIGTLVLVAALLGRTDPPQVRVTPRVAKPAPSLPTFMPVHAESSSAWTGDEGRPAPRAGTERAYVEEFLARGVDERVLELDEPVVRKIAALKAAYKQRSDTFLSMATTVLCDASAEASLREYALRLLMKEAPRDAKSRDALAAGLRSGACTREERAVMLDAVLKFGTESEVRGFQDELLRETDAGRVRAAISAMAANGSESVRRLGESLMWNHSAPQLSRRWEDYLPVQAEATPEE